MRWDFFSTDEAQGVLDFAWVFGFWDWVLKCLIFCFSLLDGNLIFEFSQVITSNPPQLIVQCWRPLETNGGMRQWLLGDVPEFVEEKADFPSDNNTSRAGIRVEDSVEVMVRLNVTLQDFETNQLYVGARGG